jgi:hypothetical protein
MFQYDSTHGKYPETVSIENADKKLLRVGKSLVKVYGEKDPANIPWSENGAEYVVESTGVFTKKEGASVRSATDLGSCNVRFILAHLGDRALKRSCEVCPHPLVWPVL